jgi:hypothetical protein
MPPLIFRERVFNAICLLIGRLGRFFGFKTAPPFIILGTGRSGTNLVEDILKTHPGISGFPGEANEIWHPMLEPFESSSLDVPPIEIDPHQFSEASVANWPIQHEQKIRDIFAGYQFIAGSSMVLFTKSAMISFLIPKILEIFPGVKFIHVYRFGLSVVESYFKKNYGKYTRHIYSEKDYRLHCAKYWNDCILEIEKTNKEFSLDSKGQFLEIKYESLCQNPRDVLVDLAEYLGVSADDFGYDISKISSQNYKADDRLNSLEGLDLLAAMSVGMELKGYTPEGLSI